MRRFYLLLLLLPFWYACQDEAGLSSEADEGYISLQIGTDVSTNITRATEETYDGKVLRVDILKANGELYKNISSNWNCDEKHELIKLPVGSYYVKARSADFDGKSVAMDKPYYEGQSELIEVGKGAAVTAKLVCTLANVKVTVKFDESFNAFSKATATIGVLNGTDQLNFVKGVTTQSGYFPVKDLYAKIAVVTKSGAGHNQTDTIKNVKAKDHYIFTYKVADSGKGGVTINVDGGVKTYTYEFAVPTTPSNNLEVTPNAWTSFVNLEGKVLSSEKELDLSLMKLQYKLATASDWTDLATTVEGEVCKATITGLTPGTEYHSRMVYNNGEVVGDPCAFTTEVKTQLPNSGFENWYQSGDVWYPNLQGEEFWDTSNPGSTALGASYNVTTKNETIKHGGNASVQLRSRKIVIKFAAASLYTGEFDDIVGMDGAKIKWGQPFTSRPLALHGWLQYAPVVIDNVGKGNDTPPAEANIVKGKTMDMCSVYIALTTDVISINNTDKSTLNWKDKEGVIAYGELPIEDCGSTNGEWKEFNIPFVYRSLTTKPTHIIVVASSSKYGDYFTGGEGSTLYLDDFELIYGDTPQTK